MRAQQIYDIFDRSIADYHIKDDVDASIENPFTGEGLQHLLYAKNWIDTVQWHLEDMIRDPKISSENALKIKRRIDASNQERTDLVEKIDDFYMEKFSKVHPSKGARLNTESPAWAIDRLSILALKIHHMEIEANRKDISQEQRDKNRFKLMVLQTQKEDLTLSIDQLLEDLGKGERIMKVYRQMKMYNDPELNPVLYSKKRS